MSSNLKSIFQDRAEPDGQLPKRRALSLSVIFLASAISISALVIGLLGFGGQGDQIEIEVQAVDISEAGTLSLLGARYSGKTQSGSRFNITAQEAVENQPEAGKILLMQPDGFILNKDGSRMNVQASQAIYEETSGMLDLSGDVQVTQSRHNLTLRATSLLAALEDGNLISQDPVELVGPNLIVTGQGLAANEAQNVIIFTGKSKLTFKPAAKDVN